MIISATFSDIKVQNLKLIKISFNECQISLRSQINDKISEKIVPSFACCKLNS